MKKLLIKTIVFTSPLLIIFLYIEFKLLHIPNSYTIKRKAIESNKKKVETLVIGSSQALYGINPSCFSTSTINLANASQSLFFDAALLNKYLEELPNLKTVIIPVSYFSLYYDMNDSKEKMRTYAYYHFFKIKNNSFKLFDVKNYSLVALLGIKRVMTVAKFNFKQLDEESIATMTAEGFLPMDSTNQQKRISDFLGKERCAYHNTLIKQNNFKKNIEILENLINTLQKRKIKVVFISTPTYNTYYQYLDSNIVSNNNNTISSFCLKYGLKYFNLSTNTNFTKQDYYDNDHLNKYGAAKFSHILDSAIIANK